MRYQVKEDKSLERKLGSAGAEAPTGVKGRSLFGKVSPLLLAVSIMGLSACSSMPTGTGEFDESALNRAASQNGGRATSEQRAVTLGREAARTALKMRGVPYVYGGSTPAGFDCSGLVYYSYAKAGIQVPRTSRAQYSVAMRIEPAQAEPGDLLFFINKGTWHVAISLGGDNFIHAPWPGSRVTTASLKNDFYRNMLIGVGRLNLAAAG